MSLMSMAEDHVMAATKGSKSNGKSDYPDTLSLNLKEAQDYAVDQNRTLKNASLAVQEAYAQRWQTQNKCNRIKIIVKCTKHATQEERCFRFFSMNAGNHKQPAFALTREVQKRSAQRRASIFERLQADNSAGFRRKEHNEE